MTTTCETATDDHNIRATGTASPKFRRPRRMAREAARSGEATMAAPAFEPVPEPKKPEPRAQSKIASVLALLMREEGATLAELVEATGWLAHTTRAALTGLRRKGHVLTKDRRGGATCWRIAGADR